MKTTPGPWHVATERSRPHQTFTIRGANAAIADTVEDHATVDAEANARLIAAAPELLEALRAALPAFDDAEQDARELAKSEKGEAREKWLAVADAFAADADRARAAIAKATGQHSHTDGDARSERKQMGITY